MLPIVRASLSCLLLGCVAVAADAATIRGTVTSTPGGSRLAGAVVEAYDASGIRRGNPATTDASGQYSLTLPAGSYRVLAYDPAGTFATSFYDNAESFETSAFVQLAEGSPLDVHFALPRGAVVSGSVLGPSAPMTNAVVEAYNLSGTRRGFATANAAGQYSLVLPAGDYKLFAYDANGVFAGEFAVNARAFADAAPVHVAPPAPVAMSFVLDPAARLSGTLIDRDTRTTLVGKLVYAYTAAGSLVATTITDASGAYRFSLGPGQYRIVAGDPSRVYAPAFYADSRSFETSDVVTLSAGEQRTGVTLEARRGAVITGRVNAASRLTVIAYNLDGTQHAAATTNETGEYTLVVAPGEYKLAAADPAGTYATEFYAGRITFASAREVAVIVGQTLGAVDFAPLRGGRFTGTIRDALSQQPLGGMTVAAYDAAGVLVAQTTTAANGTYTLPVAPAQYRLVAFDTRLEYATAYAGGASSYDTTVPMSIAADANHAADFAMRRGTRVSGTVRGENGAAIDGVEVFALDAAGHRVAGATTVGGAFTIVVLPGTYTFAARDPHHRFLARATPPVTVGAGAPAPVTLTLTAASRRRATRS